MNHSVNLGTDTLKVGLTASGTNPAGGSTWQAVSTVAQFLALSGYVQTEVTGGGYSRQALTSVSVNLTGLYTSLVVGANPSWTSSTISAVSAFFYDYTAGGNSDTAGLMIAWWDFAGTDSDTAGTFTLTMPSANGVAGALWQITAS